MTLAETLQQIHALYEGGRPAEAVRLADRALQTFPGRSEILQLKAVSLRKLGQLSEAISAMDAAVKATPNSAEMQNTYGNMLKAAGYEGEAEAAFRAAIDAQSDYAPAYKNLIVLLLDLVRNEDAIELAQDYVLAGGRRDADAFECLGRSLKHAKRWHQAIEAFEAAIALQPKHVAARYGLASCQIETGDLSQCEALCRHLLAEGQTAPQIQRLLARSLMEQLRTDEAEAPLMQAISAGSDEGLKDYTNLLWMTERADMADQLLTQAIGAAGSRPVQAIAAFDQWLEMETPQRVIEQFDRLPGELKAHPLLSIRLSMAKDDLEQTEEAYRLAEASYASAPEARIVAYHLTQACLMSGRYDRALEIALLWREKTPLDQDWIALQADALRMLGRMDEYSSLMDFERFVKPAQLSVPEGYSSLEEFHEDFIEQVHGRSPYKTHPLGQSARQGIQSPINLLFDKRPVVQNYIKALYEPVQAYLDQLGHDPENPMTARNEGRFFIGGVWSIFLLAGGRHVSHTHPHGWVSSAYYMAVPPEADTDLNRAGWIKFGEPPYKLPDEAQALHWVKPTPGTLVLFPAYMWHGTVPISGAAPRVTAPLDILPGAAH
ncbi:MAG: hypothetical protein CMK09_15250 [Ponticaulis sp.]|nr:hypothetical protein [Ponticaulis sp.]|tara:strand:+ start:9093 stop:10907 length:1815 start_codon:yes stop_codon:yes gene_type:complete